jgi:hypothetical protein
VIRHEDAPHSNIATRGDEFAQFVVTSVAAFAGHSIGSVGEPLGAGSLECSSWSTADGFGFLDGRIQANWDGMGGAHDREKGHKDPK